MLAATYAFYLEIIRAWQFGMDLSTMSMVSIQSLLFILCVFEAFLLTTCDH